MFGRKHRVLKCMATCGLAAALIIALSPAHTSAAAPPSPEVKAIVDKALAWLERPEVDDERLGGKCLIGLCFFKAGRDLKHPKIAAAQAACDKSINNIAHESIDNYSVGLALIFLLETGQTRNRSLAQRYVEEILKRQQPGGGWGYPGDNQGDTSQTQYPTLALWLARNHGITVPTSVLEKTCGWLLRTQDVSGAWGYKGNDSGNYQRINQMDVRPSLAAAGLGSTYICADAIGLTSIEAAEKTKPSALRPVAKEQPKASTGRPAVDPKLVRRAMSDGNQWFERNFTVEPEVFVHYYLYAFERYQSYRELTENRTDPNPKWYNEVVAMLKRTQESAGFWKGEDNDVIATSFAVLVLLRSAQRTITQVVVETQLGKGVLLGGLGLPPNTADLKEQDGKLVETPLVGSLDELLKLIEDPNNADLDRLADSTTAISLDSDVVRRSGQIVRLRAIVSGGKFEMRLIAVRALALVRYLDNVPVLIYALTDPDLRIVREAEKGLRFISRKLEGFGLAAEPKPQEIKANVTAWKDWYRSIRPNAEFLD